MPVCVPHGVGMPSFVANPLSFFGLCRRRNHQAVLLHYPVYPLVTYIMIYLQVHGSAQHALRFPSAFIQHKSYFLWGWWPCRPAGTLRSAGSTEHGPQPADMSWRHADLCCHFRRAPALAELCHRVSDGLCRQSFCHRFS